MSSTLTMDQRVQNIVKHAYVKTQAMKDRMAGVNLSPDDIQTVNDLSKLPVLTKDEMVRLQSESPPFGGLLAVPESDLQWVFFSPGPLYEGVADVESAINDVATFLADIGFTEDDVLLNSMSYHLVPFGTRFDGAMRQLGGTVLPTGIGNTELQLKMMIDFGATAYVGTPSFLMTLIDKAEEMGIDFAAQTKLEKAIVTAEPLPPSLRQKLQSYGLILINLYGTAELGMLGFECEEENGWHIPDNVLVQVCDPYTFEILAPGEFGEIVATTFNEEYPLICMGTGDLSILDDTPCACGRSSARLMGWLGRSGEAVKVRGMFVHPNQLRMIMGRYPELGRYQAVITRPKHRDEFVLNVELIDKKADKKALKKKLLKEMPNVIRVKVDQIKFLPEGSIAEDALPILDDRTWE